MWLLLLFLLSNSSFSINLRHNSFFVFNVFFQFNYIYKVKALRATCYCFDPSEQMEEYSGQTVEGDGRSKKAAQSKKKKKNWLISDEPYILKFICEFIFFFYFCDSIGIKKREYSAVANSNAGVSFGVLASGGHDYSKDADGM